MAIKNAQSSASGLHLDHPESEALLVTAKAAAAMCSKSLRTWRTWDALGMIPRPVRIKRSTLWVLAELKLWAAAGCPTRHEWEQLSKERECHK
jgi:hypothetical protein